MSSKWSKGTGGPAGDEHYNLVTATGPVTHTLKADGFDGSEDGTGRGTPIVPMAFNIYPSSGQGADLQATATDIANAVTVTEHARSTDRGTRVVTGTLSSRSSAGGGLGTDFEVAGGLQPTRTMAVRRLLPVECERLQGFKDDHTLIPWKGKPASECPDGPRYKAMGNSMAVPVMRWIGERLDRVVRGEL